MEMAAADSGWARKERDDPEKSERTPESGTGFYLVLTYFRETNAEALRIRARFLRALEIAKTGADHECMIAFDDAREVIRTEVDSAYGRAARIEELRRLDPETEAWYARELIQVRNAWDDLSRLWMTRALDREDLVKRSLRSVEILENLTFLCACQTIPDELTNYLANYRIGACLDFVETFKDQLCDEAATRRVLAALAPQSVLVPGLIDLKNAKVIKADLRPWRQILSVVVVLATAALGFVLIGAAVHLGQWLHFSTPGWFLAPSQWASLNGGYLLILAGVLAHWVLDRIKQNRAGSDVTPFSEWLMWIHVNEVPITVRIMTVWLLLGMGIAFKTFNLDAALQPVTYFTAGYFIDSTFDALIGRFNTFVGNYDPEKRTPEQNK